MASASDRTRQWARLGAQARLAEIEQERAAILAEFPDLKSGAKDRTEPPRRRLSAAARQKLSDGMRRYWAKQKNKG
jgi:hypothetical protein